MELEQLRKEWESIVFKFVEYLFIGGINNA
jgi:hypothetical protein